MAIYVFDSGPFIDLFRHYYPSRFPSLWQRFNELVEAGAMTSTREVFNELQGQGDELSNWCRAHRALFPIPDQAQLQVVRRIFENRHFHAMIRRRQQLLGRPVADPFVIARAACLADGIVVTTERHVPNGVRIPNVCQVLDVSWVNLEGLMEREGWTLRQRPRQPVPAASAAEGLLEVVTGRSGRADDRKRPTPIAPHAGSRSAKASRCGARPDPAQRAAVRRG